MVRIFPIFGHAKCSTCWMGAGHSCTIPVEVVSVIGFMSQDSENNEMLGEL